MFYAQLFYLVCFQFMCQGVPPARGIEILKLKQTVVKQWFNHCILAIVLGLYEVFWA